MKQKKTKRTTEPSYRHAAIKRDKAEDEKEEKEKDANAKYI